MKTKEEKSGEVASAKAADAVHELLPLLGFRKGLAGDRWSRSFAGGSSELEVDCDGGAFRYDKIGITVSSATTANFSQPENFVVFECVCRLLEKGYKPQDIELEPEWRLGHTDKGGRADIWVRTIGKDKKKHSLLIIECKTAGREFNNAWRDTMEDGAQLFSYFQQERETNFLCLYASCVADGKVISDCRLINVQDNADYLKTLPKAKRGGYASAANNKGLFAVWRDTYRRDFATQGLFENDIAPYRPGKSKYSSDDLHELDHDSMQRKYHEFATILRQHNVGGHENAFDKLVNLFLAKLVDERRNGGDLRFHWKGVAYDNAYDLQDRLQRLYTTGMKEFLGETVTYIDEQDVKKAFKLFRSDPDATKEAILDYFRQLKFYTNNDFAFLDVHNARLFKQNFEILLKIVKMLEDVRLLTDKPNQFLGDLFEGFLDRGVKQSEGQFLTPLPMVRFIVSSLPIQELIRDSPDPPRVIDYACGAAHFLNEYAQQAKPFLDAYAPGSAREYYGAIVGVEKEYRLSKVAKVAAFMYGQDDMRIIYADALARHPDVREGSFDLLVANPPFSVSGFLETLSEEDRAYYELSATKPNPSSFDGIQTFFVERAVQLLKPCGLAAIILPDPILRTRTATYIRCRDILLRNFDIVAIANFGKVTFGKTDTSTVTLFLRKKDSPPDFATHCANRAEAWLAARYAGDEVFQDTAALDRYCAKRGFAPVAYREFLAADKMERIPAAILESDAIRALRVDFANRSTKKKLTQDERNAEEMKFLRAEERERLRVFLLADSNPVPVLLVKMPDETSEAKAFLGYEWSTRKGHEGIKYLGVEAVKKSKNKGEEDDEEGDDTLTRLKGIEAIRTPLFDNANLSNENAEKINSLVRKNFRGTLKEIPERLRPFARTAPLVNLIDFDSTNFSREIRTEVSASPIQSKFPLIRLGDPDVAKIIKGVSFEKTDQVLEETGNVVLTADNITEDGRFRVKKKVFLRTDLKLPTEKKLCKDDCFMCFSSGSKAHVGKVCFISEDTGYFAGGFMGIIRSTGKILSKCLFEMLNAGALRDAVRRISQGANIQNLSGAIGEIKIPLPPLPVQQQVTDACAVVDADCSKAEADIERGKKRIAAIMAGVQGKRETLASRLLKVSGKTTKIPEGSIQEHGAIPVVTQKKDCLIAGYTDSVEPITDLPLVLFGDHSCAMKYIDFPFVRGADGTQLLKVDSSKILPRFLYEYLKTVKLEHADKYERHFKYLKSVSIPVPPIPEQEHIIAAVKAEEVAIKAARDVLEGAAARKRAILAAHGVLLEGL